MVRCTVRRVGVTGGVARGRAGGRGVYQVDRYGTSSSTLLEFFDFFSVSSGGLFNPLPTQQCCTHCFLFLQQIVNKSMRYALFILDLRIT